MLTILLIKRDLKFYLKLKKYKTNLKANKKFSSNNENINYELSNEEDNTIDIENQYYIFK